MFDLDSNISINAIHDFLTDDNSGAEKDKFSRLFEENIDRVSRSERGQFFTHVELVKLIYSLIPIKSGDSVMDPTCGAGAFFLQPSIMGVDHIDFYGVDISGVALDLCRKKLDMELMDAQLLQIDAINELSINSFPTVAISEGVDVIVGNPPFQNLKKLVDYDPGELIYQDICTGVVNSSSLVLRKSLDLLKNGGWLGFVLPKNLLRVKSFSGIRNYIVNNCIIHHIVDLGHYFKDVRGDQVILVLQKQHPRLSNNSQHEVGVSIRSLNSNSRMPVSYKIQQSYFNSDLHWPIYLEPDVFKLKIKFKNMDTNLESISTDIFRGLPLGSNHHLVSTTSMAGSKKLIRGHSINRFNLKYRLFLSNRARDLLPSRYFQRQKYDRIVLQNIVSREGGLAACILNADCYSLDTVTNVILNDSSLNQYIMGILNSRISNFFVLIISFLHSNFTMHADKTYIGKLPIVIPDAEQRTNVESIIDKLSSITDKNDGFWPLYEELNRELYSIYGLNDEEVSLIERTLSCIMSVKSNGRTNE